MVWEIGEDKSQAITATRLNEVLRLTCYRTRPNRCDHDIDLRTSGLRIGQVLASGDIPVISDGKFDVGYLSVYRYQQELEECCQLALYELSDEPFQGSASCAKVMGRAMELLRETYSLDAPRGWVPVMRKLREESRRESAGTSRIAENSGPREGCLPGSEGSAQRRRSYPSPGELLQRGSITEEEYAAEIEASMHAGSEYYEELNGRPRNDEEFEQRIEAALIAHREEREAKKRRITLGGISSVDDDAACAGVDCSVTFTASKLPP